MTFDIDNSPTKVYEKSDTEILIPYRTPTSGIFIFLYRRQNVLSHDNLNEDIFLSCNCVHNTNLCDRCASLNTTTFHDLVVPINPTDWDKMVWLLLCIGWDERAVYHWTAFWIREEDRRWRDGDKPLCFFYWYKFQTMGRHRFFHYLFKVVWKCGMESAIFPSDPNGGVVKNNLWSCGRYANNMCGITTCNAMIQMSLHLYQNGGRVVRTTTRPHRYSIIRYSYTKDARNERFAIYRAYRMLCEKEKNLRCFREQVISAFHNEVRFRPGKCGMQESMESFYTFAQKQINTSHKENKDVP